MAGRRLTGENAMFSWIFGAFAGGGGDQCSVGRRCRRTPSVRPTRQARCPRLTKIWADNKYRNHELDRWLVNGLATPTSGEIRVNGVPNSEVDIIRLRRGIGYVIQDVGLFPHFTVERNIGLVPRIEGWSEDRIRARVQELLEMVRISGELASRYPRELSGGQRQRVGVARALAADPEILLMDEPFGALDPLTRDELQQEFLSLQQRLHKTVIFVTHDLREALLLGSRIALMEAGKLVTVLSPQEFLTSADPWAAAYVRAFGDGFTSRINRGKS